MLRTKRSLRMMWISAITVVAAAIILICVRGSQSHTDRPPGAGEVLPILEAERLSPVGDANGEIVCKSHASVEFTYRIHNRGPNAIRGLKLERTCSCQTSSEVPDMIGPGSSALISFRIQAPVAGQIQKRIPLLGDQQPGPLVILDVSLRVKFDPPALLPQSGDRKLTFVRGDGTAQEIVLETLEVKERQPWICGLEIDPRDAIEVQPSRIAELPEADPSLTRRRYQFPIVNHTFQGGRHTATARILTSEGMPAVADPIVLFIEVMDSIAIVPNPLVIRGPVANPGSRYQVKIIRRTGGKLNARLADYNHDLLDVKVVEPTTTSNATFDILLHGKFDLTAETELVFDLGEDGTRVVKVRFESLPAP